MALTQVHLYDATMPVQYECKMTSTCAPIVIEPEKYIAQIPFNQQFSVNKLGTSRGKLSSLRFSSITRGGYGCLGVLQVAIGEEPNCCSDFVNDEPVQTEGVQIPFDSFLPSKIISSRTEFHTQKERIHPLARSAICHFSTTESFKDNTFSTRTFELDERRKLYEGLKAKNEEICTLKNKVSGLETNMEDVMQFMNEFRQQRDGDSSGPSHGM